MNESDIFFNAFYDYTIADSLNCTLCELYEEFNDTWGDIPPWLIYIPDPLEMQKPYKHVDLFLVILVTHALAFLIGVTGNVIIIASIAGDKFSKNITSSFLMSLAVADLLLLLVCAPLETLQYFLWTPKLTLPVCKLKSYTELLSAVASVLNLTAVSLERYIVIVYPMKSRTFCTLSNCRRAIIIVWVVSLLLSIPAGVTQDIFSTTYYNETMNVTIYTCDSSTESAMPFAVYRLVIVFLLPAIFMCIFYTRVINALWVSTKQMTAMTRIYSYRFDSRQSLSQTVNNSAAVNSNSMTSGMSNLMASTSAGVPFANSSLRKCIHRQRSGDEIKQARKQVIKMLILIIVLFMACWGPKLVFFVVIKVGLKKGGYNQVVYYTRVFSGLLPFVHSCLNPIIYSFMSTNFGRIMRRSCAARLTCRALFRGLFFRKEPKESAESRTAMYSLGCGPPTSMTVNAPWLVVVPPSDPEDVAAKEVDEKL